LKINKTYTYWIIEKSTIHKTIENDDDDDLPFTKNPNNVLINELSSDQDEQKSGVNKRFYNQLRKLDIWFDTQEKNAIED
jgi:hypothetical protein